MTVKDLERLYDYGYWANRKLSARARSAHARAVRAERRRQLRLGQKHAGAYHERRVGLARGQVALLLRALGHVPGNFDLLVYDFNPGHTGAR